MSKTIIIAEAGVNHNGDFELAKKLIEAAKEAGSDYIKFQTFDSSSLVTPKTSMSTYQKENTQSDESQLEMLKKLELKNEEFKKLADYSKEQGIGFLSSAFDDNAVELLSSFNMDYWKIPSGEITNTPYLMKVGAKGKKIILSTGMAIIDEIESARDTLISAGILPENIYVLQCTTDYPCNYKDTHLNVIQTYKKMFGENIGFSDHTLGIEAPIAAVALGARMIEKHFTLDRNLSGPDHKASLEPEELKQMVLSIRNIELALGSSFKEVRDCELETKKLARKSIVAKCNIKEGEVFTAQNLTTKRPGTGMSPTHWEEIIGQKSEKDYVENEFI